MDNTPEEIVVAFKPPTDGMATAIPLEKVSIWMASKNIEVLGALAYFLAEQDNFSLIEPPLPLKKYNDFLMTYYDRCFHENVAAEWADTSYDAGHLLLIWFLKLWRQKDIRTLELQEIKAKMEKLYREGDERIRRCLVDATLEHLFEHAKVDEFFEDWKDNELLGVAYDEAKCWVIGQRKIHHL